MGGRGTGFLQFGEQQTLFEFGPPTKRALKVTNPTHPLWTENKAKFIAAYLRLFVYVTKHGTYIDGFAGPQSETDEETAWSAKMVLANRPAWLKNFYLCDLAPAQIARLHKLRQDNYRAKRKIEIYPGDFNITVHKILGHACRRPKEAIFCLLDQRTFECDWATLKAIATAKAHRKIEMFYFVPTGWFERAAAALSDKEARLAKWWGREDWGMLESMSGHERAEAWAQRFKADLGYEHSLPWAIHQRNAGQGRVMYHMVHATDHPEAPALMARAYQEATKTIPTARQLNLWP